MGRDPNVGHRLVAMVRFLVAVEQILGLRYFNKVYSNAPGFVDDLGPTKSFSSFYVDLKIHNQE